MWDDDYLDEIRPRKPCKGPDCDIKTRNPTGYCCRKCHREALNSRRQPMLSDGAAPQPFSLISVEETDAERRVWCRRYDRCLSHAAVQLWDGWTCAQCDVDDEMSLEEKKQAIEKQATYRYVVYR